MTLYLIPRGDPRWTDRDDPTRFLRWLVCTWVDPATGAVCEHWGARPVHDPDSDHQPFSGWSADALCPDHIHHATDREGTPR
jgi:hypothetical protein